MNDLPFWQVDAFTDKPFGGNPAAVCVSQTALDDSLMQAIACEMNLSETAFVLLQDNHAPLPRWFTPTFEIDLCGHATLASAHVYFTEIEPSARTVTFESKLSGPLTVTKNDAVLTMNFPARAGENITLKTIPNFVLDSLSNEKPICAIKARDLMLIYENETLIAEMTPDFTALKKYDEALIVSAKSNNPEYDFISRFFCATDTITEDPVTGSAHCTLVPYWSKQLNKSNLSAYQASKRGGKLELELKADRVFISGQAVTVIQGTIVI